MNGLDELIAEVGSVIAGTEKVLPTVENPHLRGYAENVNGTHRKWLADLLGIRAAVTAAPMTGEEMHNIWIDLDGTSEDGFLHIQRLILGRAGLTTEVSHET